MTECTTKNCNDTAAFRLPMSPHGNRREFCETCYMAWRQGALTTFTGSIPKGERIDE